MSKVKGKIYNINKTKLRHNLRRVETKRKKRERLNNYKNNVYRFMRGYYTKDHEWVGEYETVEVPEQIIDTYHFEWRNELHFDKDGKCYPIKVPVKIIDGKKTIPAHTKRVHKRTKEIEVPTRPVRINTNIKKIRKMAERKIRNYNKDELFQGGSYKKIYDVDWEYI